MSDAPLLLPVVEGEGETYAVPTLLRRVCSELLGLHHVDVRPPWRLARSKMVKQHELGRVMSVLSTASRGRRGGVLVLLDQDDDVCPVDLAASVGVGARVPTEIVVACREFEAWFLASATSLREHRSITDAAEYLGDPESPRDAKGRLRHLMTEPYRETLHQAAFCGSMDLHLAKERSCSFRRLVAAVETLVRAGA